MSRSIVAGNKLLLVMLLLSLVLPSIAVAEGHDGATPVPEPTTLSEITVNTSPTIYFMLIGACILGGGSVLIFLRYK